MIATTGTVTVNHHGNNLSYSMLGCVLLLIGTFLSVSLSILEIIYAICVIINYISNILIFPLH